MDHQQTNKLVLPVVCLFFLAGVRAQNLPVILEVESGAVGTALSTETEADLTYITTTSNGTAGHPERDARLVTLEVTFLAAQTYDLYVRLRVGPGAADNDSFFYAQDFGTRPYTDAEWVRVNNIHSIGHTGANEVVDGNGGAGTNIWKWVNVSEFSGDEPPLSFEVSADALTRTFQIGAREDGLDIDKIAFAPALGCPTRHESMLKSLW